MLLTYNPYLTLYTHRKRGIILLNEIHQISLILSLTLYTHAISRMFIQQQSLNLTLRLHRDQTYAWQDATRRSSSCNLHLAWIATN
jgi:hypothetical protein